MKAHARSRVRDDEAWVRRLAVLVCRHEARLSAALAHLRELVDNELMNSNGKGPERPTTKAERALSRICEAASRIVVRSR